MYKHVTGLGERKLSALAGASWPQARPEGGPVCVLQEDWWLRLELDLQLLEAELQAGVGLGFSSDTCQPLTLRPGCV